MMFANGIRKATAVAASLAIALTGLATAASAASTVVVTPTNTQGWSTADTRPGGSVDFADSTAPGGTAALRLTTDATTTAKAQYLHDTNTPITNVTELSYYTKQVAAPLFPQADPSYQVIVCLTGVTGSDCSPGLTGTPNPTSFSTLVYEPYQGGGGAVVPGVWQQWDVDQGLFWSSRTVVCSNGTINGTPGGPATYTLAQIKSMCPNAVVTGFGVNIGTNNPSYNVETDLVDFNGTTYDFEVHNVPTDKDQCKNNGYKDFTDANGQPFKNQGQCVSYTNHN